MYRGIQITQEILADFCDNTNKELTKLNEDAKIKNAMVIKIEEQLTALDLKIETNRILLSEKNDNMIYRLSVINDKMIAVEQKTNELNKIMMKHFAYKESKESKESSVKETKDKKITTFGNFPVQPTFGNFSVQPSTLPIQPQFKFN